MWLTISISSSPTPPIELPKDLCGDMGTGLIIIAMGAVLCHKADLRILMILKQSMAGFSTNNVDLV
jgi:hypothetical protein